MGSKATSNGVFTMAYGFAKTYRFEIDCAIADTSECRIRTSSTQHLDPVFDFTHVSENSTKLTNGETSPIFHI
jgi:hypothetical protein